MQEKENKQMMWYWRGRGFEEKLSEGRQMRMIRCHRQGPGKGCLHEACVKRGESCRYLRKTILEKRATEDEMVGWYRRFNGHELGRTPRDGEEQGGPACCSPWGRKESDMTWQLNNNNSNSGPREQLCKGPVGSSLYSHNWPDSQEF